jgi:hypothetical protein
VEDNCCTHPNSTQLQEISGAFSTISKMRRAIGVRKMDSLPYF